MPCVDKSLLKVGEKPSELEYLPSFISYELFVRALILLAISNILNKSFETLISVEFGDEFILAISESSL